MKGIKKVKRSEDFGRKAVAITLVALGFSTLGVMNAKAATLEDLQNLFNTVNNITNGIPGISKPTAPARKVSDIKVGDTVIDSCYKLQTYANATYQNSRNKVAFQGFEYNVMSTENSYGSTYRINKYCQLGYFKETNPLGTKVCQGYLTVEFYSESGKINLGYGYGSYGARGNSISEDCRYVNDDSRIQSDDSGIRPGSSSIRSDDSRIQPDNSRRGPDGLRIRP